MKSTTIQMERGYAGTYVTILHPQKLQIETLMEIRVKYFLGEKSGTIIQEPNSRTDKEAEITWFRNSDRGVVRGLDYYGWTLDDDWSNDNHKRFEKLKKLFPESAFGSTNVAPFGWREMSPEEFANNSGFGSTIASQYNQIRKLNDGTPLDRILFVHLWLNASGTGFGIETQQDLKNGGKVIYYHFAFCEHDYTGKNIGNCEWLYTCSKCGHTSYVDSSG